MRLGAVTRALVADRSPEAQTPEALFAAAAQLGLTEFELPARGWDEPGSRFVERVNESGSLRRGVHTESLRCFPYTTRRSLRANR